VRKRQATFACPSAVRAVPRGTTLTPAMSPALAPLWSMRAIEHDGIGRR
jgi:hypothetical protein